MHVFISSLSVSTGLGFQMLPLVLLFLIALIFGIVMCAENDDEEESPPALAPAANQPTAKKTTQAAKPVTRKKSAHVRASSVTATLHTPAMNGQKPKQKKVVSAKVVKSAKPVKKSAKTQHALNFEPPKAKSNAVQANAKIMDNLNPPVDGGKTNNSQKSEIKGHHSSSSSSNSRSSYAHFEPRKTEKLDFTITSTIPAPDDEL